MKRFAQAFISAASIICAVYFVFVCLSAGIVKISRSANEAAGIPFTAIRLPTSESGADKPSAELGSENEGISQKSIQQLNLCRYTKEEQAAIFFSGNKGAGLSYKAFLAFPGVSVEYKNTEPTVFIYHTHGTEAYSNGSTYQTDESFKTADTAKNIIEVGKVFAEVLESNGIKVIHDTTMHDLDSYSDAYDKSAKAIEQVLKDHPSITCVIDIHRDSIESNGVQCKPFTTIDGKPCAQIMLVCGTGYDGWEENIAAAVKLQYRLNRLFPTLARPVYVTSGKYNQNLKSTALLIEIGAAGNSLEEAKNAAYYTALGFVDFATASSNNGATSLQKVG